MMVIQEMFHYLKAAKDCIQFDYVHNIHCVAAVHN
jgi:hypothetical protein